MIPNPTRRFDLLTRLQDKVDLIKEDHVDKTIKYESLVKKHAILKENYKSLEQDYKEIESEKKIDISPEDNEDKRERQRSLQNEQSLMKDLNYWKSHCKKLTERLAQIESQQDKPTDMEHLKLIVGLTTLLDTDDPKQVLSKLKSVIQENNKLKQENEIFSHQTLRQKEAHHQYKQINEQLQDGFEKRLTMGKDALKDTFALLQEKIDSLNKVQKHLADKDNQIQQLKLEFNHFKKVNQNLVEENIRTKNHQIEEIKKLADTTNRTQDSIVQELSEKINILQHDLANTKQKEYLYNREVSELKRLLTNDTRQWVNDIIKEVK